jgi:acyl-CoA thioester hydrolase
MEKHFRYYLRVRYSECDAQKVVFNSRYSEYVDVSTSEFLRALGFGEALSNGSFDFQLVKQTLEWKASARHDEVLEISVHAKQLGNTSFTLGTEFRIAGLSKVPLPADLRAAMTYGAHGKVIDHAGYLAEASSVVPRE